MTEGPPVAMGDLAAACGDLLIEVIGDPAAPVEGLAYDSHRVVPGWLFFCVPGRIADGHDFAADAVAAGAAALVVQHRLDMPVPQVVVSDVRRSEGRVAGRFFGHPARDLMVLGVTGTNGKTTTTYLLESILHAAGHTTGLIGTIETKVAGRVAPGVRTTPDAVDLQELLAEMVAAGVGAVAMEVTSHALVLHRVEGIGFEAAAFTNLTQDHLDFHAGMEDYFQAKRSLFVPERTRAGAVNLDDPYGRRLMAQAPIDMTGFGLSHEAAVRALEVDLRVTGTDLVLSTPAGEAKISTPLVGGFNVSNCLAACATALAAGIGLDAVTRGIESLEAVPGRFESVDEGQPFSVVVDYAHTPDSLDNVLREARRLASTRGGRVVVVFGCGGDRDRAKRPLMGQVAARLADVVIVTSDNPRSERPEAIIGEILSGLEAGRPAGADAVIPDRADAIAAAVSQARAGDVVVIAGKGHETGQTFADRTIPFDDREVARRALVEAKP